MKDNIRLLVTLGFMAVLTLMVALATISLVQLQSINTSMERLVEVTNMKTAAANDMRDAIRLRSDSLKTMRLTEDLFERDEEHQRFIGHAGKYRIAREKLVSLGMDEREAAINNQLQQLTKASQPYNDSASELLMSNAPEEETSHVMAQAFKLQALILNTGSTYGKQKALHQYQESAVCVNRDRTAVFPAGRQNCHKPCICQKPATRLPGLT